MKFLVIPLCCVMAVLGVLTDGWAHKVNVFAYVQGETVVVEGFFSGKAKAMDCQVEVLDSGGKVLIQGVTDKQGIYSFPLSALPPLGGDLVLVLNAGAGHRADYTLAAGDLPIRTDQVQTKDSQAVTDGSPPREAQAETGPSTGAGDTAAKAAVNLKAVEELLDRKIGPLSNMLGSQQKLLMEQKDKGASLTEIIGGIGWIFGLFGTAAYFMSRKGDRSAREKG
jgi:nickel transport protein